MNKRILIVRTVGIIVFIAIFFAIMAYMNYVFVSSNEVSKSTWGRYSKETSLDTLFVGSSVGWLAMPQVIDEISGTKSFNISTPSQHFKTSDFAVRFVAKQHPLKRVVLIMNFGSIAEYEDYVSDKAFKDAMLANETSYVRTKRDIINKLSHYDSDFISTTDSINIWFDWVMSFTSNRNQINENLYYKKNPDKLERNYDKDYVIDFSNMPYDRKDYAAKGADKSTLLNDIKACKELNLKNISINDKALKYLDSMAGFCRNNDISFVMILSPYRSDYSDGFKEEYELADHFLNKFATERGGLYFNLDRDPKVRSVLSDDMFTDHEHINDTGNALVSEIIAEKLSEVAK